MPKKQKRTDTEKVLIYQNNELDKLAASANKQLKALEQLIAEGASFDYEDIIPDNDNNTKTLFVPSYSELLKRANKMDESFINSISLLNESEIKELERCYKSLQNDFDQIHQLDFIDYSISAVAGILSGIIDVLFVGVPGPSTEGVKAGKLSDYIREQFQKHFPEDKMKQLESLPQSKVPYDARYNADTKEYVEGLSTYYHRLLSLGHDPILGWVVGVFDILTGRMTTIDKGGRIISQIMEGYADRKESNIFAALCKQFIHLKTDVNTSMGLPAPFMALFNLLQFGEIGEEDITIAELVQGMYYQGYDFIQFCSSSIPVMIIETIVRLSYYVRRRKQGFSIKESIPTTNRKTHPKLGTMLFLSHSLAFGINAGKIYFSGGNPTAINYPEWIAFAKYSYQQFKWVIISKPMARLNYIDGKISESFSLIENDIDKFLAEYSDEYVFVFDDKMSE